MEIKGKLIKKMPQQTGQGRNGEWKKQDIILETIDGNFPKKICVTVWGDRVNVASLAEGSILNASVDVESREFNDKWYTDVKAWKIDVAEGGATPAASPSASAGSSASAPPPPSAPTPFDAYDGESAQPDDLPF